jgi:exopolyphosphatase / guanosine-5'-triphosphate,3'-diphosphate pyrophosphatase
MDGAKRVATLDIGTNSVLLLIAEATPAGPRALLERATITRLGQGVDQTRQLAPEARARTLACIREYAADIARLGVTACAAVGTSAMRDATGGEDFKREVGELLGVMPEVIDGSREAALTFRGALSGLSVSGAITVFDVGGGSTEIVQGERRAGRADAESSVSLDVGSVRLFERHVRSDPPTSAELARVAADVDAALARAPSANAESALVGVAGTVTTLASIALKLDVYDPARVHGSVLEARSVHALAEKLAALTLDERKALTGLDPRRADVIVVGASIVERVMQRQNAAELIVSDRGVRWGLAEELCADHSR